MSPGIVSAGLSLCFVIPRLPQLIARLGGIVPSCERWYRRGSGGGKGTSLTVQFC